jgi:arylsulfatase A-like enzyme
MDAQLGRLLDTLKLRGTTLYVIVAGDHGEGLGDHGEDGTASSSTKPPSACR